MPKDRAVLEGLQFRASTALPTYRDAITRHPGAICLASKLLTERRVRVVQTNDAPVGFSVLLAPVAGIAELDGLFVDPAHWRQGVGRELMLDAVITARFEGALTIEVTANPDATGFYLKLGFTNQAETQTRFGPALRMSLSL